MNDEGPRPRRRSPLEELEELLAAKRADRPSSPTPAVAGPAPPGLVGPPGEIASQIEPTPPAARATGQKQTLGEALARVAAGGGRAAQASLGSKLTQAQERPGLEELLIRFEAAGIPFATPMTQVLEIGDRPPTTLVPGLPPFFPGLANLRGEVVLVLNLPAYITRSPDSRPRRSLLLHGQHREVVGAVLVDEVHGIAPFAPETIKVPASAASHALAEHERGVFEFHDRRYSVVSLLGLLQGRKLRSYLGGQP